MEGVEGVEGRKVFLAMCNGVGFEMNDLVDVFVGTVKGVRGNKILMTIIIFVLSLLLYCPITYNL